MRPLRSGEPPDGGRVDALAFLTRSRRLARPQTLVCISRRDRHRSARKRSRSSWLMVVATAAEDLNKHGHKLSVSTLYRSISGSRLKVEAR
jgi:hypothetical protein